MKQEEHHTPPGWADRLLESFCAAHLLEEVQGDLQELYGKWVKKHGVRKARWLYIMHAIKFFRPYALKRITVNNPTDMFKNYFIIAIRNLLSKKVYSIINIAGLSIGITCCIFIFLYVHHELSYDNFHEQGDRIYRVIRAYQDKDGEHLVGITSPPFAVALVNDFPGIVAEATRFYEDNGLVTYEETSFVEKKFCFADANFFQVFSFPLIQGNPETALSGKHSVVITQEMTKKYFGNEDPMGRVLEYDGNQFTVTGVLRDTPKNSTLTFDFIASMRLFEDRDFFKNWWLNAFQTYVLLGEKVKPETLQTQFPNFIEKYMGNDLREKGLQLQAKLQPISAIYFQSNMEFESGRRGNQQFVYIFALIALFILVIACINFMNMATAQSAKRSLEVGVRKTLGAMRSNLVFQFITESLGLAFISTIVAIVLIIILQLYFNQLVETTFTWPFGIVKTVAFFLIFVIAVGLLAGSYPALVLSAFRPIAALKGKSRSGRQTVGLRQGLVVFQFFISIVLIIATLVITRQIEFVSNKKLGYDKDHIMLVPVNNLDMDKVELFKDELRQNVQIQHVSSMSGEPGGFHDSYSFEIEGHQDEAIDLRTVFTDHDYVKILGLKIVAGRNFSRNFSTDEKETIIINEAATRFLGWQPEEAIGKEIQNKFLDSIPKRVIGVVADYNYASLHSTIDPLAIAIGNDHRVVAIKLAPGNTKEAVAMVEDAWQKATEQYPFAYNFLDQEYDNLYKAEQKQRILFRLFAILAIFIACLGLFGLVTFTAEQRTKEIGIRKVLGASVLELVHLISKDFTRLVFLALLVATPVAYWAMNRWLNNFAYHIDVGIGVFVVAGLIALAIAWFTVSFQSIKAAIANPVDSLRNE